MFGDSSHMSWGWTTFGAVHMLLFWIVLTLAIVVLIKALGRERPAPGRTAEKSALDILKERYARGEIDKQEFEQKRADLKD